MGRNVAAGMTGGLTYILDEDDTLIPKVCARDPFHYPFFHISLQLQMLHAVEILWIPLRVKRKHCYVTVLKSSQTKKLN